MSDPTTPVDVIARAVYESKPDAHHNRKPVAWDDLPHFGWSSWQTNYLNRADAIIAALRDEGYGIYDTRSHCLMGAGQYADLYTLLEGDTPEMEESARGRLRKFWNKNEPAMGDPCHCRITETE